METKLLTVKKQYHTSTRGNVAFITRPMGIAVADKFTAAMLNNRAAYVVDVDWNRHVFYERPQTKYTGSTYRELLLQMQTNEGLVPGLPSDGLVIARMMLSKMRVLVEKSQEPWQTTRVLFVQLSERGPISMLRVASHTETSAILQIRKLDLDEKVQAMVNFFVFKKSL